MAAATGQRLSSAFDDARYDNGSGTAASALLPLSPAAASLPRSSIYARAAEYFVAPVGTVSSAGNNASAHELNDNPDRVLETLLNNDWRRSQFFFCPLFRGRFGGCIQPMRMSQRSTARRALFAS